MTLYDLLARLPYRSDERRWALLTPKERAYLDMVRCQLVPLAATFENAAFVRLSAIVDRLERAERGCRIYEYDGSYKCYTHNRVWGAVSKPDTPCAGWDGV